MWYINYVIDPQNLDKKWFKNLRNCFWILYLGYVDFLEEYQNSDYFSQWDDRFCQYKGRQRAPISLLVMESLRYPDKDVHLTTWRRLLLLVWG